MEQKHNKKGNKENMVAVRFSQLIDYFWDFVLQFSPNMVMQPGVNYMQHQQSQQMMPQSLMAARAPMLYAQQHPYLALQQQQALQSQLGMSSTGMGGIHMLQSEPNVGGNGTGAFSDLGRSMTGEGLSAVSRGLGSASKQDVGSVGSAEGRRGYLGGQGADKGEALYFKSAEERDWEVKKMLWCLAPCVSERFW